MDREKLAELDLEGLYRHDYDGFRRDPVFAEFCARFVRDELGQRARVGAAVLDVGCGNGEFLQAVVRGGFDAEGFDVSPAAAALGRRRGLVVRAGDFSTVEFERRFDVITFWDVLEHLQDPCGALHRAMALLTQGGVIFVKTPCTGPLSLALASALPRLGGPLLHVPAHIQFFGRASLETSLRSVGYVDLEWLPSAATRSPSVGGRLRTRAVRLLLRGLHRASGDGNLMVFGTKPHARG